MDGEILVVIIFLGIGCFQIYRISKVEVFMKKDAIFYFLMAIGAIFILVITTIYGKGWLHYLIGLLGTTICILSPYVFGITHEGITCYQSGGGSGASLITFIGRSFKFKDITNIDVQKRSDKLVLKFVYYGSEKKLNFSVKDVKEIEKVLNSKRFNIQIA